MNQIEQTPNGKDYFEPMHSAEHLINGAIAGRSGAAGPFRPISKRRNRNAISAFTAT